MMSDFGVGDGLPLVVGSVRGHRVWRMQPNNTLTSPQQVDFEWNDGEMRADCTKEESAVVTDDSIQADVLARLVPSGTTVRKHEFCSTEDDDFVKIKWHSETWNILEGEMRPELPPRTESCKWKIKNVPGKRRDTGWNDHWYYTEPTTFVQGEITVSSAEVLAVCEQVKAERVPKTHMQLCSCGFYAYYDSVVNAYATSGDFIGVFEGYGETVLGTLGFRSSKGKIIALAPLSDRYIEAADSRWKKGWFDILEERYPSVAIFMSAPDMFTQYPLTRAEEVLND